MIRGFIWQNDPSGIAGFTFTPTCQIVIGKKTKTTNAVSVSLTGKKCSTQLSEVYFPQEPEGDRPRSARLAHKMDSLSWRILKTGNRPVKLHYSSMSDDISRVFIYLFIECVVPSETKASPFLPFFINLSFLPPLISYITSLARR